MSNCVHLNGQIRINDCTNQDFSKIFIEKEKIPWKDVLNNKKFKTNYMPFGSEGSIEYEVKDLNDECKCERYIISIWGDLRDRDSTYYEDIKKWWNTIINQIEKKTAGIRNAVLQVESEYEKSLILTDEDLNMNEEVIKTWLHDRREGLKEFQTLSQKEKDKFCSYCGCEGGCNLCYTLDDACADIIRMYHDGRDFDFEIAHSKSDELLCIILKEFGFEKTVKEFKQMFKAYS